jgi:hypothetical protein
MFVLRANGRPAATIPNYRLFTRTPYTLHTPLRYCVLVYLTWRPRHGIALGRWIA